MPCVLNLADGQGIPLPQDYTAMRQVIWENKNTQLPSGVLMGPGNPPAWVEVTFAADQPAITFQRAGVSALRPA